MAKMKTKPTRGRPRGATPPNPTTGIRLPDDVRALVDAEVTRINESTPGASASVTSVIIASIRAHCGAAS